jgi:hypothetical protein
MFTPADKFQNPIKPIGQDNGGGFTAPAYLEQRQDTNGDGRTEPTVQAPGQNAPSSQPSTQPVGPTVQAPTIPSGAPAENGNTPFPTQHPFLQPQPISTQPVAPPIQFTPPEQPQPQPVAPPISPVPSAPSIPFTPAPQPVSTVPTPATQIAPVAVPPISPVPAAPSPGQFSAPSSIFANDPTRPGSGYVMVNGQPKRIAGTTAAGTNPDGTPKMPGPNDRYIFEDGSLGDYVNVADYTAWVNGQHGENTTYNDVTGAVHQNSDLGTANQGPLGWGKNGGPQEESYLQNGLTVDAAGNAVQGSNGYNALNDAIKQALAQGVQPGVITPYMQDLINKNPKLTETLDPAYAGSAGKTLAGMGYKVPTTNGAGGSDTGTPSSGVGAGMAPAGTPAQGGGATGSNGGGAGGAGTPGAGGGATGSGGSSGNDFDWNTLGSLIMKLVNNPSTYDDATFSAQINNKKADLQSMLDQDSGSLEADMASRGLLMGSPTVIGKDALRTKRDRAMSDFETNLTADRARTMAADRQQAFNNVFGFLGAANQKGNLDLDWAKLAAAISNAGQPGADSGGTGNPQFGGLDPSGIAALLQLLFGGGSNNNSSGSKTGDNRSAGQPDD